MFKTLHAQYIQARKKSQAGFSVLELIVIMSIFAVMASVSLYNFRDFDDSTNINNLALDVALEIKRAQTLGSSSIDDQGTGDKSAMSVVFQQGGSNFEQKIMIVRQFPDSGGLNGGLSDINIGGEDILDRESQIFGGTIADICLRSGTGSCDPVNSDIAISFRRPYTEPLITASGCSDPVSDLRSNITYYNVCLDQTMQITIEGNDANSARMRTIVIEPTGNIYTRNN